MGGQGYSRTRVWGDLAGGRTAEVQGKQGAGEELTVGGGGRQGWKDLGAPAHSLGVQWLTLFTWT